LHFSAEQPFHLGYAQQSRWTVCSIPLIGSDPRAKCIEFHTPDASANPYLAFAAILMAAIDGIQNKIAPGPPRANEAQCRQSPSLPRSLWDSLDCLEQDSHFLMRGEVFSQEMLARWLGHKRETERQALESHPTPAEFSYYFDC
jgi:glutamine synthetase